MMNSGMMFGHRVAFRLQELRIRASAERAPGRFGVRDIGIRVRDRFKDGFWKRLDQL